MPDMSLMRPAPWLPRDMHGRPIVVLLAGCTGDPEEGEKTVAPVKSFDNPVREVLVRRPYAQMQSLLNATQPNGRRYYWESEHLPSIEPGLCEKTYSAVTLFQLAGALNEHDEDAANLKWAREAWIDKKQFSTGGDYINFLTEDEGPERIEAALGKTLQRLMSRPDGIQKMFSARTETSNRLERAELGVSRGQST